MVFKVIILEGVQLKHPNLNKLKVIKDIIQAEKKNIQHG